MITTMFPTMVRMNVSQVKRCPRCGHTKDIDEFNVNRTASDGRQTYCKPCMFNATEESRKKDPERYNAWSRKRDFRQKLKRHGLTQEEYEEILARQGGVCAICSRAELAKRGPRTRVLCIDHDHQTGRVRGLLCSDCNRALGMFQDDPAILRAAVAYLS